MIRAQALKMLGVAVFLLAVAGRVPIARADDANPLELAVKATFLYKFQPFIVWPDQTFPSAGSPFNLCIVDGDPFGAMLDRAVAGQQAADHVIKILRLPALSPDAQCQIVYLATRDPQSARQSIAALNGSPVLTVTDSITDGAAKGMINFVVVDNRVRFEIDAAAAARNGLIISSKLLSLAFSVKPNP